MPNQMLTMLPLGVRNDGTPAPTEHAYQINLGPQTPQSKGHVKLRANDPYQAPVLTFNYLSTEQDRREWIEGVQVTRDLFAPDAPSRPSTEASSRPAPMSELTRRSSTGSRRTQRPPTTRVEPRRWAWTTKPSWIP